MYMHVMRMERFRLITQCIHVKREHMRDIDTIIYTLEIKKGQLFISKLRDQERRITCIKIKNRVTTLTRQ